MRQGPLLVERHSTASERREAVRIDVGWLHDLKSTRTVARGNRDFIERAWPRVGAIIGRPADKASLRFFTGSYEPFVRPARSCVA
jgi:hypothetical protein